MGMKTDEEMAMAGLTDDERAALAEPDEDVTATQEELEAKAALEAAQKEDDNDGKAETKTATDAAAAVADVVVAAAATAPADAGEPTAAAAAEPSPAPSAPVFVAKAPEDAKERLEQFTKDKEALMVKHDDGDITTAEFHKALDAIHRGEREIELAVAKAQIAEEMEVQRQKNQWDIDCRAFMDANKEYSKDEDLFKHLNETIIAFNKMPRNQNLSGPQLLAKAHATVMLERGTPVAAPAAAVKDATPAAKPAPKPALPPSLGSMPAATPTATGENKYAGLDALQTKNPAAYEKALLAMSETEREAYLEAD